MPVVMTSFVCLFFSSTRRKWCNSFSSAVTVFCRSPAAARDGTDVAGSEPTTVSKTGIFKYDMGWQKRGSGRSYNSKSGVGAVIGNRTGKICGYGIRVNDCRKCQFHRNKGEKAPQHNCYKNWSGTAKGMEPDVGVEIVQSIEEKGVRVETLVMDDDTTTMSRIRRELDHKITKWSDTNHTAKHLVSSLYALQKKHKSLTSNTISYLKKCFNYALAQTKGDPEKCKEAIGQIVPHAFGNHERCGEWCGAKANPTTYEHKTMKKDLFGESLHQDLKSVFEVFSSNAEKIAPGGSTREVESFNNVVASKAQKRTHFSGSGNLSRRVGCAVAQKNMGNTYVSEIFKKVGLSPGKVSLQEAQKRDSERKRQLHYERLPSVKRRKVDRKLKENSLLIAKENKEGTTYKSAVATRHPSDLSSIPAASRPPAQKCVEYTEHVNVVFCDIETSSLQEKADILQIAACCCGATFNQYITPTRAICTSASVVTGLTTSGNILFRNGSPVVSLPLKEALQMFLAWLQERTPVVLAGHNFLRFDFPRLVKAFEKAHLLGAFIDLCTGGIDTLQLFRDAYPQEEKHTQEHLFEKLTNKTYAAHDAANDVESLQQLCHAAGFSKDELMKYSFTTQWYIDFMNYRTVSAENTDTMQSLVDRKVISKQMATKIGSSGLQLSHLTLAFRHGGKETLSQLLTEKVDGTPRVTTCKRVLSTLADHFDENS